MKQKHMDEDVMKLQELFWQFSRAEISLAELQQRVKEIAGKQLKLPEKMAEATR